MSADQLSPRSREKRDRIRAAAQRLFLEQGVAATSMDAITAEAGVSKQTVYAHFSTKQELLGDVLGTLVGQRAQHWQALRTDGRPLVSRDEVQKELESLADVVLDALLQPEYLGTARIVIAESVRDPSLGEQFSGAVAEPVLRAVGATIRRGQDGGVLREAASEDSPRLLVGGLLTFVLLEGLLRPHRAVKPSHERVAALVRDFVGGLAAG